MRLICLIILAISPVIAAAEHTQQQAEAAKLAADSSQALYWTSIIDYESAVTSCDALIRQLDEEGGDPEVVAAFETSLAAIGSGKRINAATYCAFQADATYDFAQERYAAGLGSSTQPANYAYSQAVFAWQTGIQPQSCVLDWQAAIMWQDLATQDVLDLRGEVALAIILHGGGEGE